MITGDPPALNPGGLRLSGGRMVLPGGEPMNLDPKA
jgi:hypothetical protein